MSPPGALLLPPAPPLLVEDDLSGLARTLTPDDLVVVDHGVRAAVEPLRTSRATVLGLDPCRPVAALVDTVLRGLPAGRATVVAVGGGTVMDAVKLAAAVPRGAESVWRWRLATGYGRVALPREWTPAHRVVCVPTTLGTSSESNATVVLRDEATALLVQGRGLTAAEVRVSEQALHTLSQRQRRLGLWEILLRLLGPYVDGPSRLAGADLLAEPLISHLLRRVVDASPVADDELVPTVLLGTQTHRSLLHAGRLPFAHPLWALCHEVAHEMGVSKMSATLTALPGWVDLLTGDGEPNRGKRLERCLGEARTSHDQLLAAAASLAGAAPWRTRVDADRVADRLRQRWVPLGYPALYAQVEVVRRVLGPAGTPGEAGAPADRSGALVGAHPASGAAG